jgi:ketosteroid isomerase-like protein
MSQRDVDAFWRGVDAYNRGDGDAWVELFHLDAEFIPLRAPIQGTYRGHDELREFLSDNVESFDLFQVAYEDVRDLGDRIVAIGTLRIRGKGSGAEIEVPSAVLLTYRDAKVVRFEDFGNRQRAFDAAGLSERDAQTPQAEPS